MKTRCEYAKWKEYDMLAKWCAKHGVTGGNGTVLPDYIGADTMDEINADIEAFERRVRESAYMVAREGREGE